MAKGRRSAFLRCVRPATSGGLWLLPQAWILHGRLCTVARRQPDQARGRAMNEAVRHFSFLRELSWNHLALTAIVLIACRVLVLLVRRIVRSAAESAPSHRRLLILRMAPLSRLLI